MSLYIGEPQLLAIALAKFRVWTCEVIESETQVVVEKTRHHVSPEAARRDAARIITRLVADYFPAEAGPTA